MQRDLRGTSLFREAEALFSELRSPGSGQICDAAEVHASPDGRYVVFSGTLVERLEGLPPTRICLTELTTGVTRVLTFGPNSDRSPRFSPDGRQVAFLSDRHRAGDHQLYLLDLANGVTHSATRLEGWVEYLRWSPGGEQILLGVAGHGADISGVEGAVSSERIGADVPSWMPMIDDGPAGHSRRGAWVYDIGTSRAQQVSDEGMNIWEAVWCGSKVVAAVVSSGPGEGDWYAAALHLIDLRSGMNQVVYTPKDQLGWLAACPSGSWLAFVEALSSDRCIVAGGLQIINIASGDMHRINTNCVDVTYAEWRSDRRLLIAGHRGFETVVGFFEVASGSFWEIWQSCDVTSSGRYVSVTGLNDSGDCVLLGESYLRAPEVAIIRDRKYTPVRSFDLSYSNRTKVVAGVEKITWKAPDGLDIQGWLLRPHGEGMHPLVMNIHGGPVWHWRPMWLGRSAYLLMLIKRGYAIFLPNPRGSSGRGQEFVRPVFGDIGGADARDLLSGLDALVSRGLADPKRLGLMGMSYGGFMTAWLVTQDPRFAAAVALAPHTNQVSEHLLSNIPELFRMLLADKYSNPDGRYFQRSPVMHAHKAKVPTLNVCGGLDRCTPAEEALQFHKALLEHGAKSALVTYSEEGHGVKKLPAAIDFAARVVAWFEEHMGGDGLTRIIS